VTRKKYKLELLNRCGGMIERDGRYFVSSDNAEAVIDMIFDDLEEYIEDRQTSTDLGYLTGYPQFGRMEKKTNYAILAIPVRITNDN